MSAELGRQILEAVKAYVAGRVDALASRIAEAEAMLRAFPKPEKGEPGEKGDRGEPGETAKSPTAEELRQLIGPMIPAAEQGPRGEKGERGERGADSKPPSDEELRVLMLPLIHIPEPVHGQKGAPGERGEPGEKGDVGQPGERGELGEKGDKGEPGERGEKGERGERGERGEKGDVGPEGPAPTDDDLRFLMAPLIPEPLRGEKGERGDAPSEGELRQIIAPLIPAPIRGEKGEAGTPGREGIDGEDGAPGRDALALEILPAIEDARSYPRGSYAKHAGGLWRAFEATHGMRGWECLLEGIASETEQLGEDGRTVTRTTVYSSGRAFERSFAMAVVLDKGVYKPDATYAPGDAVTWGGSIWIAQKHEGAYSKPGTAGSGWRLSVKAGRDGRGL
jgi:hypothetical protein